MKSVAFVDAANLFYGGQKSLGWSIDNAKLREYLNEKYGVTTIYFFGGVEIHKFPFDYIKNDTVPLRELKKYLDDLIKAKGKYMSQAELLLLDRHVKRVKYYLKLESFGYTLILKPVKTFTDEDGNERRKANCDVDMTFYMMRERDEYDRAVVLTGDGDFLPVLKYLKGEGKEILILARGPRTAKAIKQFAGDKLLDFEYLRERLKRDDIPAQI